MAGNAQAVIDLDKKRMQAMAKKDVATLQSVLADDLILPTRRPGSTPRRA